MLDREPSHQALQARWDRSVAELAREDPGLAERVAAKRKKK